MATPVSTVTHLFLASQAVSMASSKAFQPRVPPEGLADISSSVGLQIHLAKIEYEKAYDKACEEYTEQLNALRAEVSRLRCTMEADRQETVELQQHIAALETRAAEADGRAADASSDDTCRQAPLRRVIGMPWVQSGPQR